MWILPPFGDVSRPVDRILTDPFDRFAVGRGAAVKADVDEIALKDGGFE